MKLIQDKQNPLLKRKEVKIIIEAEKNPTMQEASKSVAEKFKIAEEVVAVKQIKGKFGRKTFLISAHIYDNKEDKEKIEPKSKKKKGKEEKPAEQPAEENKEEPKEEAKPEENKEQ